MFLPLPPLLASPYPIDQRPQYKTPLTIHYVMKPTQEKIEKIDQRLRI